MSSIFEIKNIHECIEYIERLEKLCIGTKTSMIRCERMKYNLLEFCKENFIEEIKFIKDIKKN
jgi:hypothetical protein